MCVIGMHRAGTSAFARVVNLLGVPLADGSVMKQASPVNPTGFWEVPALTAFNDQLLATLGGHWSSPPELDGRWAARAELESERRVGAELFRGLHPGRQWVWKDPRNCLLLPFWATALKEDPVVVLCHRSPLEVQQSLAWRDGFPKPLGLALWERYLRAALVSAAGRPVLVASYSLLLEQTEPLVAQLRRFLERHGIECTAGSREQIADFVDRDLKHASFDDADALDDPDLSEAQRRLIALLRELEGEHLELPTMELPPESSDTEVLLASRRDAALETIRVGRRLREREEDWARRESGLLEARDRLHEQLHEQRARNTALKENARHLDEQLREQRARNTALKENAGHLDEQLRQQRVRNTALKEKMRQREAPPPESDDSS